MTVLRRRSGSGGVWSGTALLTDGNVAETDAEDDGTPEAFLRALGARLEAQAEGDAELAKILTTHIIKADAAQNGMELAKRDILKLAAERANPTDDETSDG